MAIEYLPWHWPTTAADRACMRDTTTELTYAEVALRAEAVAGQFAAAGVRRGEQLGDTSSVRFAVCGAAPVSVELLRRSESRFGFPIIEGYGLTEGTCASTINPLDGIRKPGTVGVALPGQRVATMRADGSFAAPGEPGEVVIKGPTVMRGYLGRPEATAETIVDGLLHTGDVGVLDEDGYLTIVDRIKDMMGFTKPDLPPVDPDTFMRQPLMDRMKVLSLRWAEHGFGTPRMVYAIYIAKLLFFYILGGVVVATTTSRLPAFWHVADWWNQPIVYEKAVLWTVLLETIGVAGSWGPLAGKFKPMTGGIRFWARTGTIRLRPWKRVPFTAGDRRTVADVALYLALLVAVAVPLVLPGVHSDSLSARVPGNTSGLVSPVLLIAPIVLLVLCGLRDKVIFLAARGEQYLPTLVFFAVLPFTDMIIALKLLIVTVWVGAGVSKRTCGTLPAGLSPAGSVRCGAYPGSGG